MGRTYIGYGYTNSEGVATLDYDANGNQLPKKSYACHSSRVSVVAEASIDNVITSSNSIRFCEGYVPPTDTLSLTADKSVLSYADNDSCTLTATFESSDSVSGKSVVFKVGDTVLDTIQTDSEGVAEYTYNSQGVGDVTFTVECMNLQETYEVEDCFLYDNTIYSSNHLFELQLPSSHYTFEFDILKKTSGTNSQSTGGIVIGETESLFMVGVGSETNYYIARWGTNITYTTLTLLTQNTWKPVKLEINGTSAGIIIDGVTYSVTGISADTSKLYRVNCNSNNLNIRNIKIKPL